MVTYRVAEYFGIVKIRKGNEQETMIDDDDEGTTCEIFDTDTRVGKAAKIGL